MRNGLLIVCCRKSKSENELTRNKTYVTSFQFRLCEAHAGQKFCSEIHIHTHCIHCHFLACLFVICCAKTKPIQCCRLFSVQNFWPCHLKVNKYKLCRPVSIFALSAGHNIFVAHIYIFGCIYIVAWLL